MKYIYFTIGASIAIAAYYTEEIAFAIVVGSATLLLTIMGHLKETHPQEKTKK